MADSTVSNYVDLLAEQRKSSDFMWASRYMEPLAPHHLLPEDNWTRSQAIEATLVHPKVLTIVAALAETRNVDKSIVVREARAMLEEMASKQHLPTFRWLGKCLFK